jgi:hypothetical membrane protein
MEMAWNGSISAVMADHFAWGGRGCNRDGLATNALPVHLAPMPRQNPLLRLAGVLWLCAGLCYLASEAIAAAAFPGYSYATNYISDLGVPYEGMVDGRPLRSGLAWVMNFGGFILDGVLFAAAAIAASRVAKGQTVFLALALVHAAGTILVGLVHSGDRELAAGIHHFHVIGGAMAIVGGNAALIASAGLSRRLGLPAAHRIAGSCLGGFGLLAVAVLEFDAITGMIMAPVGLLERCSVYPITAWEIVTGLVLLWYWAGRRRFG